MKRLHNHFSRCLYILLTTILISSCTLIDNDLREETDKPAPEVKDIVSVDTEDYHLEYKYNNNVRVLDKNFLSYIASIDYKNHKLYLNDYIPEGLLPEIGQILFSSDTEKQKYGISGKVTGITRTENMYAVDFEAAPLSDIYDHLVLDGDFEISGDFSEDSLEIDQDGDIVISRADDNNKTNFNQDMTGEWTNLNILGMLSNPAASTLEKGTLTYTNVFMNPLTFKSVWPNKNGAVEGEIDVRGSIYARWRPIYKCKCKIDKNKNVMDMYTTVGIEAEYISNLTGTCKIVIHLLRINPALAEKLKVEKLLVPQVLLWLVGQLDIDLELALDGSLTSVMNKKYYLELGGRNNIKGQEDGLYMKKHNKPITFPDMREWEEDAKARNQTIDAKLEGSIGLYIVPTIKLLLGVPDLYPEVGIQVQGKIGPKCTVKHLSSDPYTDGTSVGIYVSVNGSLYFNLFPHVTFDWSFTDFLMQQLGYKDGLSATIPLGMKRRNPSIDDFQMQCTNPGSTEHPKFKMSFNVKERGYGEGLLRTTWPYIRIYNEDGTGPLYSYAFQDKPIDKEKSPTSYTLNIDNLKLERDKVYLLEIEMNRGWRNEYISSSSYNTVYKKTFKFTANAPSAIIDSHFITYMGIKMEDNGSTANVIHTKSPSLWDWKFRTIVDFSAPELIKKWGFYVNDKIYVVDHAPLTKRINVIWALKNRKKAKTNLNITPFTAGKDGVEASWPLYKITLDADEDWAFCDPEWGKDAYGKPSQYRREKINGKWYYIIGYDTEETLPKMTGDTNISASRQSSFDNDSGENISTLTIELEDDE